MNSIFVPPEPKSIGKVHQFFKFTVQQEYSIVLSLALFSEQQYQCWIVIIFECLQINKIKIMNSYFGKVRQKNPFELLNLDHNSNKFQFKKLLSERMSVNYCSLLKIKQFTNIYKSKKELFLCINSETLLFLSS